MNMQKINLSHVCFDHLQCLNNDNNLNKTFGSSARVFAYQNKAIKIFNKELKQEEKKAMLEKAKQFENDEFLMKHHAVVPEKIVVIDGMECGYTTEIVQGWNLFQLMAKEKISNVSYESFMQAYLNALEDIRQITEQGILMMDSGYSNIMYDYVNNQFQFIDLLDWEKVPQKERNEKGFLLNFNQVKFKKKFEGENFFEDKFVK